MTSALAETVPAVFDWGFETLVWNREAIGAGVLTAPSPFAGVLVFVVNVMLVVPSSGDQNLRAIKCQSMAQSADLAI